jgi:hypothetical protein
MSEQLKDFLASTTLNGAISDSDLTLVVASAANFPTGGTFDIRIDNEILTVTGVAGTTFTVTRAAGTPATTAAPHANGVAVKLVLTKRSLEQRIEDMFSSSAFLEAVDDRVDALLVEGSNITLTYDDGAGTLTIAASGGTGGGDPIVHLGVRQWFGVAGAALTYAAPALDFTDYVYRGTAANNDAFALSRNLPAGTYTFSMPYSKNTNQGIGDLRINGAVVDSFDGYNAGGALDAVWTKAGIVVAGGSTAISIKVNGKNAGSSAYYFVLRDAVLVKTA